MLIKVLLVWLMLCSWFRPVNGACWCNAAIGSPARVVHTYVRTYIQAIVVVIVVVVVRMMRMCLLMTLNRGLPRRPAS